MARVEFGALTQFGRIEPGGLVHAMGLGFNRVQIPADAQFPVPFQLSVIAVVAFEPADTEPCQVKIAFHHEAVGNPSIEVVSEVRKPDDAMPGRITRSWLCATLTFPLTAQGRYDVQFRCDERVDYELSFDVEAE